MAIHTYTKLFSSITDSAVWCEPMPTRIVWITMLAMSDRHGCIFASVPGLANRARVSVEECEVALATFRSPDRYSRTPDHEGRCIVPIDGGWQLLNHAKYRDMRDEAVRREQNREAQERHRNKASAESLAVSRDQPGSAHTDADIEAVKDSLAKARVCSPTSGKHAPPTPIAEIIETYHQALPMCPRMVVRNATRDSHITGRWKQIFADGKATDRADGIAFFRDFFEHAAKSKFLTGRAQPRDKNRAPFVADLDWLMRPSNFANTIEGKYHR